METLDELRAKQGTVAGVEPAPQEAVPEEPTEQTEIEETAPVQPEPPREGPNQKNIRELREKARRYEQLEREHQETKRRLQEIEGRIQPKPVQEEEDLAISPDDIAEGRHLNKIVQKFERRIKQLEGDIEGYKKQSTAMTEEARLKAAYPDIERVVNEDTVEALKEADPEFYATINASSDFYNKAVATYKQIKRLNLYAEDNYKTDRDRVALNAAKPRPLASVTPQQGESPLSRAQAFAGNLTDDIKQQYWKEMQEAIKAR